MTEDKSLKAMIQNDEEKSWMLPLLDFRNYIAAYSQGSDLTQNELDRGRRDFRRMTGNLTWHNNRLVHGPYTKEVREDFLRRLLKLQLFIQETGPEEVRETELITMDELRYIRKIWLDEKHEFDDMVPKIYKEITGKDFEDHSILGNKYYGKDEWDLLSDVCKDLYPDYELMVELQSSLLDMEAKNSAISSTKNVVKNLEAKIKHSYYKNEEDAEDMLRMRRKRQGLVDDSKYAQEDETDTDEPINTSPLGFEEEDC